MVNTIHFQFPKRTFHRHDHWPHTSLKISRTRWVKAVISWLFGIIWKQKILHQIKQILHQIKQILHKIKQNTIAKKYRYISIIGTFFRYRFSFFFFKYRNSLLQAGRFHHQLYSNIFTSIWCTCPANKNVAFHTGMSLI
jgi:hypothetical protein